MTHDTGRHNDGQSDQAASSPRDDFDASHTAGADRRPAAVDGAPGQPTAGSADPPVAPAGATAATTEERESEVREALRVVVDPEIGIDVVTLGLIRSIAFDEASVDITMILTTPFCPYGGMMVQQVKSAAEEVHAGEVHITLGDEVWSPDMMEGGDWAEWGLV